MNVDSSNSAARFLAALSDNPALRERVEQAGTAEEKLKIIRSEGYSFTREEWKAALENLCSSDQLADESLEGLSGGILVRLPDGSQQRVKNVTDQVRDFLASLFD